jgi:DNA-binding GntR family transcriptional regulator
VLVPDMGYSARGAPERRSEGVSPAPEYPKIVEALRELITTGQLPRGSTVPSEAALAARFGVARNTLRRALAELDREGLLATIPGRGRIICAPGVQVGEVSDVLLGYRRIAADLRGQIERGAYSPGERLPSEAALTRRYGVSRDTARRALGQLRTAGLARVAHGKGWFARGDATGTNGTS